MNWTWDYVENTVTWSRLEAINASLEVVPANYEMIAFVACAHGYKFPEKKTEDVHPGAALLMMAPHGYYKMPQ